MSYQVIARKYRPQRFSDVVGQEHVTQTLSNAIAQSRIAHAYLFVGPRGTGKTTVARIFAKCLNATNGPKVEFDESDPRCKEITEGRSLDVLEIDGASNRGIDEIRELRETVKYAPASSRFKIYIIDEVHMLTKEAFNALLKTLEEPPAHVKFMFATTEPEKVLATILSRCQRFDLRRIPTGLIVKHLAHISKLENVVVEDAALYAIARGADGGMRDAESALDQLISFCGAKIMEADVLSMFGLTAQAQILQLARAVVSGSTEQALRELNALAAQGKDLTRLLTDLLSHFRNLLLFQVSGGDLELLEIPEAEAASLKDEAGQLPAETLSRLMEVFADFELRLRDASSKKIMFEVALLKAIEARQSTSIDAVLRKLQELRSGSPGGSPAPVTQAPAAPAPVRTPAPIARVQEAPPPAALEPEPTPAISTDISEAPATGDLESLWAKLLDLVGRSSPFARSYLLEGHPVSLDGKLLKIGYEQQFADHLSLVDNAKNHAVIQTKLAELGYPDRQVKFIRAERTSAAATRPAAPVQPAARPDPKPSASPSAAAKKQPATPAAVPEKLDKEDFKNDPLIKKALEVFKGRIVDVRG